MQSDMMGGRFLCARPMSRFGSGSTGIIRLVDQAKPNPRLLYQDVLSSPQVDLRSIKGRTHTA